MQRQKTSAEGATENVDRLHHCFRVGGPLMSTRHSVANNENRFSLIVATPVASVQPKNEKHQINVPMEVLLSAMLVRRTERADDSTRQLEQRSVSERLAGRSLRQSGSGSMTGRRSRHRRSAASAVSRRRIGQGVAQSPVPNPTDHCSYCRAVVRRGGRSEEC